MGKLRQLWKIIKCNFWAFPRYDKILNFTQKSDHNGVRLSVAIFFVMQSLSKHKKGFPLQSLTQIFDFRFQIFDFRFLSYLREPLNALPILHFLMFKFYRRDAESFAKKTERIFDFGFWMYDFRFLISDYNSADFSFRFTSFEMTNHYSIVIPRHEESFKLWIKFQRITAVSRGAT
jgi:hypothetical protein